MTDTAAVSGTLAVGSQSMHGILFKHLKEYVEAEYDHDTWEAAMTEAGIEPKLYLPITEYPDEEADRLIDGVVSVTGADESALLDAYGEALAPALLDTFEAHVNDDWDALDLLERTDNQVFTVFYSEDGDDEVTASREDEDTVVVRYASPLATCELATGVLRGIAEEHGESVDVSKGACMDRGADHCELTVTRS